MHSRTNGRGGSQIPTKPTYTKSCSDDPRAIPTTEIKHLKLSWHMNVLMSFCVMSYINAELNTNILETSSALSSGSMWGMTISH
jgi:hypothetical protein